MIGYNQYPSLLFLSYHKDNAPENIPFEVTSMEIRNRLAATTGYAEMFGIIASLNSFGFSPTHYYLNNKNFREVEFNHSFRNTHFRNFFTSAPKELQYGCICFKDGGQYVYLYLPPDKAKIKGLEDAYFCAALFKENFFIGFEEALLKGGLSVMPTGIYPDGMDIGGYLSFVSVSLSFFSKGTKVAGNAINLTTETIWTK